MVVKTSNKSNTNRITLAAMLAAAAIITHTVEALLPPLVIGVPVKLGLANIFTLLALMKLSFPYAGAIAVLRCLVGTLISGAVSQLPYSLSGAILSLLAMALIDRLRKSDRISTVGQSVFGSFAFNLGQLLVGIAIVGKPMMLYFPVMSLISIPTGIFTGIASHYINKGLSRFDYEKQS